MVSMLSRNGGNQKERKGKEGKSKDDLLFRNSYWMQDLRLGFFLLIVSQNGGRD